MAVFELLDNALRLVTASQREPSTRAGGSLRSALVRRIDVISPDTRVISTSVADWAGRELDYLGIDQTGCLVVIDLFEPDETNHLEHALRHAGMAATLTREDVIRAYERHLTSLDPFADANDALLAFFETDELPDSIARDVRAVIVAEEIPERLRRAVLWLNARSLDVRCVRLKPLENHGGRQLFEIETAVPQPGVDVHLLHSAGKLRGPHSLVTTENVLHLVGDLCNALGEQELAESLHPRVREMIDQLEDALYYHDRP